jgi:hypothetical protein
MFSRPKSLNLSSSTLNPIVFPSLDSSNQMQSHTRRPVAELPRLTLSFTSESGDEMDGDPLEKQKPADIATFGDHHVV